ncbi:HET-domain-containing protein [Aspergillus sclerotioniger CBS 115572]|uniref:HET-domain-containing protein n=1 Tax=Aspergillus sclerotioniger CBS 115572 TaxID=1450535 RepID=A0A317XF91_9EURO|nr:HET-domain-containing protein [Aspergillus sclerotioniger CBS 115572]PWY95380.1 HET-domain-containing protein [Aspergillus sclerotioniger CBS 115572]
MCGTGFPALQICHSKLRMGKNQDSLQATRANINDLGREGSLTAERGLMATINDAIDACCHLQIPFLWVDRLCIVQDELSEKSTQLNAMGTIYSQSYVTLVAMAGSDANYGLPGTDGRKRSPQWTGEVQGIYLFENHDPYGYLVIRSKWRSRGWTFQEATLSPKLLIFTDPGVFYQCHGRLTAAQSEEGEELELGILAAQIDLSSYKSLVTEYTTRDLTYESDIMNAFVGILHMAYGDQHYYGIPFKQFSWGLLWQTAKGKYPVRCPHEPNVFPSWSWSSINNVIAYYFSRNGFTSLGQWAIPPSRDGSKELMILPNPSTEPNIAEYNDQYGKLPRHAVLTAWKNGCFPGTLPEDLKPFTSKKSDTFLKSLASMHDEAQGMPGGLLNASDQEARFPLHIQQACQDGCILVYTQSQRLRLLKVSTGYLNEARLQNAHGDIIALVPVNTTNWEQIDLIPHGKNGAEFDVLALSMSYNVTDLPKGDCPDIFGKTQLTGITESEGISTDYPMFERGCSPEINLMVVDTKIGISRRVALGKATLKNWIKSKPKFQTFILG